MNAFLKTINFSFLYAIMFGIVSSIAALIFVPDSHGDGWEHLWIYTGSAAFITAFLLSKLLIEKKENFKLTRIVSVAIAVAILGHWLSWYESIVVNYAEWKFFGMHVLGDPLNPLNGIYGALQFSIISIVFFGWIAIPVSVGLIVLTKRLKRISTKVDHEATL